LTRERHPGQSIAIGFGTYKGSVTASRGWGDRPERMPVPRAQHGSYDNIFHEAGMERFLLSLKPLRERDEAGALDAWRGHRASGRTRIVLGGRTHGETTRERSRGDLLGGPRRVELYQQIQSAMTRPDVHTISEVTDKCGEQRVPSRPVEPAHPADMALVVAR